MPRALCMCCLFSPQEYVESLQNSPLFFCSRIYSKNSWALSQLNPSLNTYDGARKLLLFWEFQALATEPWEERSSRELEARTKVSVMFRGWYFSQSIQRDQTCEAAAGLLAVGATEQGMGSAGSSPSSKPTDLTVLLRLSHFSWIDHFHCFPELVNF